MSTEQQRDAQAATTTQTEGASFLDQVLDATKFTERDRAKDLVKALVGEALQGTLTYDKSVDRTIKARIAALDAVISKQLSAIMHHAEFQKLEGAWRGLNYLVMNSETSTMLKIRVLNVSKRELFKDLDRAVEFDQSTIFQQVYTDEFGMAGGEPFGAIVGDYEFTNHPEDIDLLGKMSNVAAAGFCPFISAASPQLFGFKDFTELCKPRDLAKIFDALEYIKWRSFRDSEDSRFVTLTMPRTLARLPYGKNTKPVEEFDFEEVDLDEKGNSKPVEHGHYTWMNTAYTMAQRLTDAFAKYGFCTKIRGYEGGGGLVQGLPVHLFKSMDGDTAVKCPTEIAIPDRRENELSNLGFLPLCHYKNTDYAVFFGGQTCQKPKKYNTTDATENAAISARLPYLMAVSRIAHFLKVIARDRIGTFMEVEDCQKFLDNWIMDYVSADPNPSEDVKARYPLRDAKIEVREVPGEPGHYNCVAYLRPWLQLEQLTASLRLVARIPQKSG